MKLFVVNGMQVRIDLTISEVDRLHEETGIDVLSMEPPILVLMDLDERATLKLIESHLEQTCSDSADIIKAMKDSLETYIEVRDSFVKEVRDFFRMLSPTKLQMMDRMRTEVINRISAHDISSLSGNAVGDTSSGELPATSELTQEVLPSAT